VTFEVENLQARTYCTLLGLEILGELGGEVGQCGAKAQRLAQVAE
jgi:hypothetical protein